MIRFHRLVPAVCRDSRSGSIAEVQGAGRERSAESGLSALFVEPQSQGREPEPVHCGGRFDGDPVTRSLSVKDVLQFGGTRSRGECRRSTDRSGKGRARAFEQAAAATRVPSRRRLIHPHACNTRTELAPEYWQTLAAASAAGFEVQARQRVSRRCLGIGWSNGDLTVQRSAQAIHQPWIRISLRRGRALGAAVAFRARACELHG